MSLSSQVGDTPRPRGGTQWALRAGIGVPLGLAALLDADIHDRSWPLAVFLAVSGLALAPLVRPGPRTPVLAAAAVTGSLVATAVLVARADHDFSLLETGALLLLLVDRWRVARRPGDWALVVGTVTALMVLPLRSAVSEPDIAREYAGTGLAMLLGVTLAVIVATVLRGQDAHRAAAVAAVRRAARAEIARELHDVVAHHVTGIVVATQAARTVAADGAGPPATTALAAIEDSGSQALGAMRRLVGVLRTDDGTGEDTAGQTGDGADPRTPTPTLSDLDELVSRFRDSGAAGRVDLDVLLDDRCRPAPELQAAAYRVIQEALTNASRHAAGAARVQVGVTAVAGGVLEIEVTNTAGRPAPAAAAGHGGPGTLGGLGGGFGVIGMRERAQALGGHLAAGPRHDGGWTVHATIPMPPPDPDVVDLGWQR